VCRLLLVLWFLKCNVKVQFTYHSFVLWVNHFEHCASFGVGAQGPWFESFGPQKRCSCPRITLGRSMLFPSKSKPLSCKNRTGLGGCDMLTWMQAPEDGAKVACISKSTIYLSLSLWADHFGRSTLHKGRLPVKFTLRRARN